MKFESLNDLIGFEKSLTWTKASGLNLSAYKMANDVRTKFCSLKGEKYAAIYNGEIVSVVSDQFRIISVSEIADVCDKVFGPNYAEKSYKEGIVRIYDKGIEDKTGKATPLVVYPSNLGNMAVKLGIFHNAYICSNGLIMADNKLMGQKIIHRSTTKDLTQYANSIVSNLELALNKISIANEIMLDRGTQLSMIIQGLEKNDSLIKKALSKYAPINNSLWSTVQAITHVSTHETKNGFAYSRLAGEFLLNPVLSAEELVDAASYAYAKKEAINFENKNELFKLAADELTRCIA